MMFSRVLVSFLVIHVGIFSHLASTQFKSSTAYKNCTLFPKDDGATNCVYYTSLFYNGVTSDPMESFEVLFVGSSVNDPTRDGSLTSCPVGKTCTVTTPTTVTIDTVVTTGTTQISYSLKALPFTIPWSYFMTSEVYGFSPPPVTQSPCSNINLKLKSGVAAVQAPSTNPPAYTYYPDENDEVLCDIFLDYLDPPHVGSQTPPLITSLPEYGVGYVLSPAPLASYCEKCVLTKQRGYTYTSFPNMLNCECSTSADSNLFALAAIDLAINNANKSGQCTVYQVGAGESSTSIMVTVQTADAAYNQTLNVGYDDAGGLGVSDGTDGNAVVAIQSLGTVKSTGVGAEAGGPAGPEQGSLLVLCPRADGTLADVSQTQSCASNGADTNLWFYIPLKYASYYGTDGGSYGASVNDIMANIIAVTDDLPTSEKWANCVDLVKALYDVPGYANRDGTFYDSKPGSANPCSIAQISPSKEPIFDADVICYKSVSLQTMYSTMVHSPLKDQWTLPGVKAGISTYDIVDGALVQKTASSSSSPPKISYSLRIDVADTFMKYIPKEDSSGLTSGHFLSSNSSCVYTNRTGDSGQVKATFCSDGFLDGTTTKISFNLTIECEGKVANSNSSLVTQSTPPLAVGDCATVLFPLVVNLTAPDGSNLTACYVIADTADMTEDFLPCTALPAPPLDTSSSLIWFILGGAGLLVAIGLGLFLRGMSKHATDEKEKSKKMLDDLGVKGKDKQE